jgi:hypothetical protein
VGAAGPDGCDGMAEGRAEALSAMGHRGRCRDHAYGGVGRSRGGLPQRRRAARGGWGSRSPLAAYSWSRGAPPPWKIWGSVGMRKVRYGRWRGPP